MEESKTEIARLFEDALPYLGEANSGAAQSGFEESGSDAVLDRLADIGQKIARLPSQNDNDKRCKAQIYRALAPELSATLDSPTLEEQLLWSIIDDLDPGER